MPEQAYGQFTVFNPPLVVDGVDYVIGIRLTGEPEETAAIKTVSSGFVHATSTVSGTTKRVVFKREQVTFSYTDSRREIQYPCLMHGHMISLPEPERPYSPFAGSRSIRGDDSHTKGIVGDTLWGNNKGFRIIATGTTAPAEVAWQGSDPLPIVMRLQLPDLGVVFCDTETEFGYPESAQINLEGVGVYGDYASLYVGATKATRVIFSGDPDLYPTDASFGDVTPEYWVDPYSGSVRLSTYAVGLSPTIQTTGVLSGIDTYIDDVPENPYFFLHGSGVLETCPIVSAFKNGGFTAQFLFLGPHTDRDYVIGWREDLDSDSRMIVMMIEAGTVTDVMWRETKGGLLVSLTFTPEVLTDDIDFYRSGTNFAFYVEGNPVLASHTFTGLDALENGHVFVGTTNLAIFKMILPTPLRSYYPIGGYTGVFAVQQTRVFTIDTSGLTYDLVGSTAITSVTNVTTDTLMEDLFFTPNEGRDKYDVSIFGNISFNAEAAGDEVLVIQAADVDPPAVPGRIPRMAGTATLATQDSTNVAHNKAHWHDHVDVEDPHDELDLIEGDAAQIQRWPWIESLSLEASKYGAEVAEWLPVSSSDYLARLVEGIILIKSSWVTANSIDLATDRLCFRGDINRLRTSATMSVRQFHDMVAALESLDNGYTYASLGGPSPKIGGTLTGWSVLHESFPLPDPRTSSGLLLGANYNAIKEGPAFILSEYGASMPAWFTGTEYWFGGDVSAYEEDIPGGDLIAIPNHIFGKINFGGLIGMPGGISTFGGVFGGGAQAHLEGIGLNVQGFLANLPDGAEIIEANAIVQFDGLDIVEWEHEETWTKVRPYGTAWYPPTPPGSSAIYAQTYTNGALTAWSAYDANGDVVGPPEPVVAAPSNDQGSIRFVLMGRRNNTRRVTTLQGDVQDSPQDMWFGIGGGVSNSTVTSGKRSKVNVTSMIQALVNSRDSLTSDFFLFPSVGAVNGLGFAGFMESLRPQQTLSGVTSIESGMKWLYTYTETGKNVTYNSMTIFSITARFRMPDGSVDKLRVPIIRTAIVP